MQVVGCGVKNGVEFWILNTGDRRGGILQDHHARSMGGRVGGVDREGGWEG